MIGRVIHTYDEVMTRLRELRPEVQKLFDKVEHDPEKVLIGLMAVAIDQRFDIDDLQPESSDTDKQIFQGLRSLSTKMDDLIQGVATGKCDSVINQACYHIIIQLIKKEGLC